MLTYIKISVNVNTRVNTIQTRLKPRTNSSFYHICDW